LFNPLPPLTLTEDGGSVEVTQSIENLPVPLAIGFYFMFQKKAF
jgi:hypothetical protein